ncbi:MAG: cupredoxin domain-containing protein [Anaerolineales bacterium]
MNPDHKLQFAFLALLLAALAACSSTPQTLEITLVGEDIMWATETIYAKVGQPIELTLRNDGALDHNFVIEDLGIDILLSPGDIEVVPFTINEPGTILYICNIPGHEEAGMVGEIIISE